MSSSSSSSSSATKTQDAAQKRRPPPAVWANWPSISIRLPPQGLNSHAIDERCFTYCTQSISGRAHAQEPSCRSFCIRKVFRHEVRRAMSYHEMQEALKAHSREHGALPQTFDASVEVKYPLPPEGQPAKPENQLGSISLAEASAAESASSGFLSSSSSSRDEVRTWEPGWYLWSTTTSSGVHEHMDMMSWDLKGQSQWAENRKVLNEAGTRIVEGHGREHDYAITARPPPIYPDISDSSLLVHIPPPHVVVGTAIRKYLEPTHKLLGVVQESVQNGHQQELMMRMWGKVSTPEPWIIVRKVCTSMWKVLNDGPPDADGEERNKGGKM